MIYYFEPSILGSIILGLVAFLFVIAKLFNLLSGFRRFLLRLCGKSTAEPDDDPRYWCEQRLNGHPLYHKCSGCKYANPAFCKFQAEMREKGMACFWMYQNAVDAGTPFDCECHHCEYAFACTVKDGMLKQKEVHDQWLDSLPGTDHMMV